MQSEPIIPTKNRIYQNKGGGSYKCLKSSSEHTVFVNTCSGWTFNAHNVRMYEDGKIEWDYSEGGHFVRL